MQGSHISPQAVFAPVRCGLLASLTFSNLHLAERKRQQLLRRLTRNANEDTASKTSRLLSVGRFVTRKACFACFITFLLINLWGWLVASLDFWLQTEHSWNCKYHAICSFQTDFKNRLQNWQSSFLATILYHNNFLWLTGSHERFMQRSLLWSTPHQPPQAVFTQINSFHFKKSTFYSSMSLFLFWREN